MSVDIPGADPILLDLGTGLRYFGRTVSDRRPVPRLVPRQPSPLGSHPGPAVLRPAADRGGARDDVRRRRRRTGDPSSRSSPTPSSRRCSRSSCRYFPARSTFEELIDDEFVIDGGPAGDIRVMSRSIPHVGRTLGYRIEWNGATLAYLSDHQMPCDGSFAATTGAIDLCRGVDLLIHDAQYTTEEFADEERLGSLHDRVRRLDRRRGRRRIDWRCSTTIPATTMHSWTRSRNGRPNSVTSPGSPCSPPVKVAQWPCGPERSSRSGAGWADQSMIPDRRRASITRFAPSSGPSTDVSIRTSGDVGRS